jgi:uncharacterized membrane protein YoaK (UPF0700 family)
VLRSEHSAPAQGGLAAILALIAGYIDAYTFLNYQVYGSFMSGNTTQTGLWAGQGKFAEAAYNLLPIPLFVLGVFLGALLVHSRLNQELRWQFGLVAALLAVGVAAVPLGPAPGWFSIIALSLAMGIMNTSVTSVGKQSISLGYVSGTLNNMAQHLALAAKRAPLLHAAGPGDTHLRRAALLAFIWTAFVTGALLAGAATPRLAVWSLVFPILILLALAAFNPTSPWCFAFWPSPAKLRLIGDSQHRLNRTRPRVLT